ncbi:hypothetical protein BUY99_04030 [Staphylococcus gallinarum]|nr:hypothetical protein BUY99_04030 [Staphylococcus gallinarum]
MSNEVIVTLDLQCQSVSTGKRQKYIIKVLIFIQYKKRVGTGLVPTSLKVRIRVYYHKVYFISIYYKQKTTPKSGQIRKKLKNTKHKL